MGDMTRIEKTARASADVSADNIAKLRAVFPQFVKDGQVDFDALAAFFEKEGVLASEEKYGLSWAGKSGAFRAIRVPATGTLVPQVKESKDWDTTQNIFVEGDNLEVLKLLQAQYRGAIKMIYIDPPYNTGKDFIYKDNFTEDKSDYYERTGQSEGGIRMTSNPESNGRYHSDWLTMMYPRLFLAKNLLKQDGVIFISIDDNEVANLRLIMDEIFGEENFVGQFVVIRAEGGGLAEQYVKGHEYLLAFARSIEVFSPLRRPKDIRGQIIEKEGKKYWIEEDWLRKEFGKYGTLLYEEIESVKGIEKKKEIDAGIARGEYQLIEKKNGNRIVGRLRLIEEDGSKFYSVLKHLSASGNGELENLGLQDCFDFPKPVSLLQSLVLGTTFFTKNDNDLILDFFAGSGTMAHAVMAQNAEDGGNRKWICVQLPEETSEDSEARKAGFHTIADISRERIRRAGVKVGKGDTGFKSFALSSSNYRQWRVLTERDDVETLKAQEKLFVEKPLVDGYRDESVVYEVLLKEGFDLNAEVKKETRGDITVWSVVSDNSKMLVTLAPRLTREQIDSLGLAQEDTFVCFDSALDDSVKMNVARGVRLKVI